LTISQGAYLFKPSAIVLYFAGSFGGVGAALKVRVVAGEPGIPKCRQLPFPVIGNVFGDNLILKKQKKVG
jgi:hypothetical protein